MEGQRWDAVEATGAIETELELSLARDAEMPRGGQHPHLVLAQPKDHGDVRAHDVWELRADIHHQAALAAAVLRQRRATFNR